MFHRVSPQKLATWFGIAAAVSVVLAILSVILTSQTAERPFKPEPYFAASTSGSRRSRAFTFSPRIKRRDLAYAPETNWIVPSKDGYRARYDTIQRLLLAFTDLERFERKTKEPKWQQRLLLTDPRQKGDASYVRAHRCQGR